MSEDIPDEQETLAVPARQDPAQATLLQEARGPPPDTGRRFRLAAKGFFLTFPQCPVSKQEASRRIQDHFPSQILWSLVAQEKHQDGTDHLHAFIKLEKKATFNNKLFDLPDHHGNYQVAKSWKHVKQYVTKGGNFIASIDVESA